MDWLLPRQPGIEDALAARHLRDGTLVLYDVSSAAFEGRTCPLGQIGHPRDGVRGRLQIVYGVLTTTGGIPVAAGVFTGATGDPATLTSQVKKIKSRFGLTHVAVAGDRGMLAKVRIRDDLQPARLDWITALRGPAIAALMAGGAPTRFRRQPPRARLDPGKLRPSGTRRMPARRPNREHVLGPRPAKPVYPQARFSCPRRAAQGQ